MLRRIALIALSWLAATPVLAANMPIDVSTLGAPSFTVFTAQDRVPDEAITAVETDRLGFVWLGSASTIAQFDGHSWQNSAPAGFKGMVRDLHLDRAGTLWAAFDAGGIARYDGARWHLENQASGLPTEHIFTIAEMPDKQGVSTLWLATADSGLLKRDGNRWVSDPGNAQLPVGHIASFVETKTLFGRPLQWVSVGISGVWFREPEGDWQRYQAPGFSVSQATDIVVSENQGQEELWIVSYGDGLWQINADGLRDWAAEFGTFSRIPMYTARATKTPQGERVLWVASRVGLMRLHNNRVQVFDRSHGLPSNAIRNLETSRSSDGVDILWIATEAGVARLALNASPWQTPTLMGASANGVFNLLLEPDSQGGERLWVAATHDGLGLLQNGRWRYFNENNGQLPHADVRSVQRIADADGVLRLFVGMAEGELLRVQEAPGKAPLDAAVFQFERLQTPWPKGPGHAVMQVLSRQFGGAHEIWVATRLAGIYRLRNGQWTPMSANGAANPWTIVRIAEQVLPNGESWLWATTNQGLARYDGTQWQLLHNLKNLPESNLIGLSLRYENNSSHVLWLGSARNGTVQVDVTDPRNPSVVSNNVLPKAPDPSVYSALHDSQGRIYICTNNGVQQLTPRTGGGFDERIFRRRDGLVHEECNTNAQFIDSHDRYWIGTLGGLSVYDPNVQSQIQKPSPKALLLTDILLDNRRIDLPQSAMAHSPSTITIAADVRELRFNFALMTAQRETETRYRTHVIGYDLAPLPWSSQTFRSMGKPPPGTYTLQIEGRDFAGVIAIPIFWTLEITPAWFQRGWVQSLAALLALLGIYSVVRWRLHAAVVRQRQLQEQVDFRTVALNAANSRLTELSYLDSLTGIANRRFFINALNTRWEAARTSQTSLAVIILDVDFFKAFNDQFGHLNGDQALREVAAAMQTIASDSIVIARYGGEEFACVIHPADLDVALDIAEQIRTRVESLVLVMPSGESTSITISAGIAARIPTAALQPDDLLREADGALYLAKRTGRNRLCTTDTSYPSC